MAASASLARPSFEPPWEPLFRLPPLSESLGLSQGDEWVIRTTRIGDSSEYTATIDVERIAKGNPDVDFTANDGIDPELHYTIIEITKLRKQFRGRTLGNKDFLRSMYRADLDQGIMRLEWNGEVLEWEGYNDQLLKGPDGSVYK